MIKDELDRISNLIKKTEKILEEKCVVSVIMPIDPVETMAYFEWDKNKKRIYLTLGGKKEFFLQWKVPIRIQFIQYLSKFLAYCLNHQENELGNVSEIINKLEDEIFNQ